VLAVAGSKDNARDRRISAARAALLKNAQGKFTNSKAETRLPARFQKFLRKLSELSQDAPYSFSDNVCGLKLLKKPRKKLKQYEAKKGKYKY
jgi:hypothetical protein